MQDKSAKNHADYHGEELMGAMEQAREREQPKFHALRYTEVEAPSL